VLVLVPVATLDEVGRRELPVLGGVVDPRQQTLALLAGGEVEEDLDHADAAGGEVLLPLVDRPEAPLPDVLPPGLGGQVLPLQVLRVHPNHQHLLVVRAVVDADDPAGGKVTRVAPEEVVIELVRRGDLEAAHPHALRVDAAHHVLDRTVLAGGVECLQDDQHAVGVLGRQARLILAEQLHPRLQG
jgi:hypothetical protein